MKELKIDELDVVAGGNLTDSISAYGNDPGYNMGGSSGSYLPPAVWTPGIGQVEMPPRNP